MSKQWRSDFYHGRGGSTIAHEIPRTCLHCGKSANPRFLYCSDACSEASRAELRGAREAKQDRAKP
jgi:hypothetical protein